MDKLLGAVLRTDLASLVRKVFATVSPGARYCHNWHIDAIVYKLMRVHTGQSRRLLINQPPRSLKSICVSIAYMAWVLGHDPTRRVIVVSDSADFGAELHRQFRMVINSAWYAALFPQVNWAKDTGPVSANTGHVWTAPRGLARTTHRLVDRRCDDFDTT